jgi:hypothetical protein
MHIQIYVVLYKEKPCVRNRRRRRNLTAVRPTTVQLTNCSFRLVDKLRHNLLHKPALTKSFCISCINITLHSSVKKDAQSRKLPDCRNGAVLFVLKLPCNKYSAYIERQTPSSLKKGPHFRTRTCLEENKNLVRGSR